MIRPISSTILAALLGFCLSYFWPNQHQTSREPTALVTKPSHDSPPSLTGDLAQREHQWEHVAENDPQQLLRWVNEGLIGQDQCALLEQAIAALAAQDPNIAAKSTAKLSIGWAQHAAWRKLATLLGSTAPEQGWDFAEQAGRFASDYKITLASIWAKEEPIKALETVLPRMTYWEQGRFLFHHSTIMADWMQRDPQATLDWLDSGFLPKQYQDSLRFFALHESSNLWGTLSPDKRDALAEHMTDPRFRANVKRASLKARAQDDPHAAMAEALNTDVYGTFGTRTLVRAVLDEVKQANPDLALELALTTPGTATREDYFRDRADELAQASAPDALEWANDIPDAISRKSALQGVILSWMHQDANAAATALANIPAGWREESTIHNVLSSFRGINDPSPEQRQTIRTLWDSLPANQQLAHISVLPDWHAIHP